MRLYENDIQETLIEAYARKEKEVDGLGRFWWRWLVLHPDLQSRQDCFHLLSDLA